MTWKSTETRNKGNSLHLGEDCEMQDVVSTGQQRAITTTYLFMNARVFLYILADLQCRCFVHSAIVKVYDRFQSKNFKRIIEIFQCIFFLFFV